MEEQGRAGALGIFGGALGQGGARAPAGVRLRREGGRIPARRTPTGGGAGLLPLLRRAGGGSRFCRGLPRETLPARGALHTERGRSRNPTPRGLGGRRRRAARRAAQGRESPLRERLREDQRQGAAGATLRRAGGRGGRLRDEAVGGKAPEEWGPRDAA